MSDPFDLARFVRAQEPVWDTVLRELGAGEKRTHWMWFVFPQLAALGRSATARRYGISGLAEARAYLDHPLLGARLAEATELVTAPEGRDLAAIFGYPDDLKFRSSMTLFAAAADAAGAADDVDDAGATGGEEASRSQPSTSPYRRALELCCDGRADPLTLELLP